MWYKKTGLVIAFVITGIIVKQVHAQEPAAGLTLTYCLETAIANNLDVQQSGLLEQRAKINKEQSRYNRLPNIAAGLDYGINNGRSIDPFTNSYNNQQLSSSSANVNASLPVFTGFKTSNAIQQNDLNYEASKLEWQQEKDNLSLSVILAFLQLMNDEDLLQLTTEQMDITFKQVNRLEALNKEGAIAPALLYDMKGQYASDQVALANAKKALELAKLNLSKLMNVPYSSDFKIDRTGLDLTIQLYEVNAESIYSTALQNLSMVKAADLRVKAAAKGTKVAAASLFPTVSLYGQLGTNYSSAARLLKATGTMDVATDDYVIVNGNNSPVYTTLTNYNSQKIGFPNQYNNNLSTYFGINISIPIFSAFQTRSTIKLAKIEEKRTGLLAENTKTQLRQSIDEAYIQMKTAFQNYQAVKNQVEAYQESFRSATIRFNLGAINSVEYLIVKNNLDRASVNLTISQYEYLLRTKVLDFYQGIVK